MSAALWTTKYAPTSMEKIVGQTGPSSNARKLQVGRRGMRHDGCLYNKNDERKH
jgi:hypothetical protein